MKRSRVIFLVMAGLFFLAMVMIGIDISSKTTFPGSKKHVKESLSPGADAPAKADSLSTKPSQK